jgi:DNA-binding ferritin-like protein
MGMESWTVKFDTDTYKFGKYQGQATGYPNYKDQTYAQVLSTEQGREWLRRVELKNLEWKLTQEKYAQWHESTQKLIDYIKSELSNNGNDVSQSESIQPNGGVTVNNVTEIAQKASSLEERLIRLEKLVEANHNELMRVCCIGSLKKELDTNAVSVQDVVQEMGADPNEITMAEEGWDE